MRVWVAARWFYLAWASRAGFVYCATSFRFRSRAAAEQRKEIMSRIWEGPMKRKDRGSMASLSRHADEDKLLKSFPNLNEFLTAATFEGSEERRESPTLTLWASGGEWKASVKDRAESLVLWLSATSLGELLRLLESFVLEPEAPWRHDEASHERNGKRRKKEA